MDKLPAYIQKAIDSYQPIEIETFKLYPFKVKDYERYQVARLSIGFMTQQLPVQLMSMPLLASLFKLDYDKAVNGETPTGLFTSCLVALACSLRLTNDYDSLDDCAKYFRFNVDPKDNSRLKSLSYIVDGEEMHCITPVQFARLRPIIAAQNGIEIIDEDANPELVEAEQDLAEGKLPKLKADIQSMVHSVAALSGTEEKDIYDWAMLKLFDRSASYKRVFDYIICGIGESQGTKWKGGNPCPSPWFERIKEESNSLIGLNDFVGGQATQTVLEGEAKRNHV